MLHPWLQKNLVCPRDFLPLQQSGNKLICPNSHAYPCIDDVPIMLLEEISPTQQQAQESLRQAVATDLPREDFQSSPDTVDPFVQKVIAATSGNLFRGSLDCLTAYPIPEIRLPPGKDKFFLDLGCNWGRWCLAAAEKGYVAVGVDHNLEAVRAARRVAKQLGAQNLYVVADARHLPFSAHLFDAVFSYSVIQHFSREDAKRAFSEAGRVLRPGGTSLIQMPNAYGLRNLCIQLKRGFREETGFEVRYWKPKDLEQVGDQSIGPTGLSVDGFFCLNPDVRNVKMLPLSYRLTVAVSEYFRSISEKMPWMVNFADSLFVRSVAR